MVLHPLLPVCALAMSIGLAGAVDTSAPPQAGDPTLGRILVHALTTHHIAGMGIAVVRSSGVQAIAVAGWRKAGDPTAVTVQDQWHIGSCTKMMTAALVARLVEQGRLHWDTPLIGLLAPGTPCDAAWRNITIDHLLCHRAGLAANLDWGHLPRRATVLATIAGSAPPLPVGDFAYSNTGYVTIGACCELLGGRTWEQLIADQVWHPLGITQAGFGGMGLPGQVDQPWGHHPDGTPAGNGPAADNPAVMGPAGTVHIPLADWARFIADQMCGARGQAGLLATASYQHLQQAWPGGDYARGWGVTERAWAKGPAYTHSGSNTMHYAVVWMAPAVDLAVLVTANRGEAGPACDEAVAAAIAAFLKH